MDLNKTVSVSNYRTAITRKETGTFIAISRSGGVVCLAVKQGEVQELPTLAIPAAAKDANDWTLTKISEQPLAFEASEKMGATG